MADSLLRRVLSLCCWGWTVGASAALAFGVSGRGAPLTNSTLVIALGMAKAGTTSVHNFFECNRVSRVAHYSCNDDRDTVIGGKAGECGKCVTRFITAVASKQIKNMIPGAEQTLRNYCGNFSVFANIMYLSDDVCLYPNVEHLELLVKVLPRACFVMHTRNVTEWLNSYKHYGAMYRRALDECPGVLPRTDQGLVDWYLRHERHVHDTLANHHCAIEVNIDDPKAGTQLADYFGGTSSDCWGHYNKSPRP